MIRKHVKLLSTDKSLLTLISIFVLLVAGHWVSTLTPTIDPGTAIAAENGWAVPSTTNASKLDSASQVMQFSLDWAHHNLTRLTLGLLLVFLLSGISSRLSVLFPENNYLRAFRLRPQFIRIRPDSHPAHCGLFEVAGLAFMITLLPWYFTFLHSTAAIVILTFTIRWTSPKTGSESPPKVSPPTTTRAWLLYIGNVARVLLIACVIASAFAYFELVPKLISLTAIFGNLVPVVQTATFAVGGLLLPLSTLTLVVILALLLSLGLPPSAALALVISNGARDIFRWQTTKQSQVYYVIGARFVIVLGCCALAGFAAKEIVRWDADRTLDRVVLDYLSTSSAEADWPLRGQHPGSQVPFDASVTHSATEQETIETKPGLGFTISKRQFRGTKGAETDSLFRRESSQTLGLVEPVTMAPLRLREPFANFRPIASGDIHNDGWDDLIIGSDPSYGGLSVYANRNGEGFVRQSVNIGSLRDLFVVNASLVDVDNDGWLDLVVSTFGHDVFILPNQHGQFNFEEAVRLKLPDDTVMVSSLGFCDMDRDGDLDAVLGRWSIGEELRKPSPFALSAASSRNLLAWNEGGQWRLEPLGATPGETTSTLFSDLNQDGWPDLVVGNTLNVADMFYFGVGEGRLRLLQRKDEVIPEIPRTTMSVSTADINNDLKSEVLLAQFAERGRPQLHRESEAWKLTLPEGVSRQHHEYAELLANARIYQTVVPLLGATNRGHHRHLMAINLVNRYARGIWFHNDRSARRWMGKFLPFLPSDLQLISQKLMEDRFAETVEATAASIPQQRSTNTLLVPSEGESYTEQSEAFGIDRADWAWNAKFADLDHDQFQDVFVATGYIPAFGRPSNYFYRNQQGHRFEDQTVQVGLYDRYCTSAYTYVDFDQDGDLDIITLPADDVPHVYRNLTDDGASMIFRIDDRIGNRFGIGTRLTIHYGPDANRLQTRELRASGGFISHDAPQVHFGLGAYRQIERLEIHWSTGEESLFESPLQTGATYTIHRPRQP